MQPQSSFTKLVQSGCSHSLFTILVSEWIEATLATPADHLSSCRAPPPPPPRGFSDSRKEYNETECDRGGKRTSGSTISSSSSSSKSHHLQPKYYKGARPRESGYQIDV
ncbi:hypothetical protein GWK47_055275 [Chionoecetes opilio]|uniref:Uncharacterized protein n=1 Tax=Chionoecetes opilio TaxID=41210 RepID=A0A8J5CRC5_CHIOP|nr:hypothetical protein GWK47_055275 [Chionoecetes opilio]